jgi:hypothetical protein
VSSRSNRLYDVGYEIDLARTSRALAADAPERPRPVRGEAQAIQIPNPPVTVRLGSESIAAGGQPLPIDLSARIFDFGVVSVRGRMSWESPRPWRIGPDSERSRERERNGEPASSAGAIS